MAKKNNKPHTITVTENAAQKLKELVREHGGVGILISVLSGGCSGIDYSLSYEEGDGSKKTKIEVAGISFFYDPEIELLIKGISIDFTENNFGHGFVVTNKNHKGCENCTCGRNR
ncbi:MAG: iron-sulfur cluster assembly accessory protein [Holosporales bacterium]|nr:iron-sulfur cluster assembly accessory protein [Holosporales bacterium]